MPRTGTPPSPEEWTTYLRNIPTSSPAQDRASATAATRNTRAALLDTSSSCGVSPQLWSLHKKNARHTVQGGLALDVNSAVGRTETSVRRDGPHGNTGARDDAHGRGPLWSEPR